MLFDLSWTVSGLIGAALAPTDPAVTFSVLAGKEVEGRSGTILEGESGFNDPVGIALMIGMVELATSDAWLVRLARGRGVPREMGVGLAVGVAGALAIAGLIRFVPLPDRTLYPLALIIAAGAVYGLAGVLHGSGFLAVFVAGILVGDLRYPARRAVRAFNCALADLGELAAFVALGLTINLAFIGEEGLWWRGLVLAVLLGFVVRPLVAWPLLAAARLSHGRAGVHRLERPEGRRPDPARLARGRRRRRTTRRRSTGSSSSSCCSRSSSRARSSPRSRARLGVPIDEPERADGAQS